MSLEIIRKIQNINVYELLSHLRNTFNRNNSWIIKGIFKFLLKYQKKMFLRLADLFNGKINKKLMIFSAMFGMGFVDNPKYLYLYARENTNYRCIWMTKSRDLYTKLKNQGFDVMYLYTLESLKAIKTAGYIIIGWTLNVDIVLMNFSTETLILNTYHGNCLKKDGMDVGNPSISREAHLYNYLISPSPQVNKYLISAFRIDPGKIIVTGLPKNDILFNNDLKFKIKLKKKYKIQNNKKKVILYAPTFRDYARIAKFPLKDNELFELDKYLEKSQSILLLKAHFAEKEIKFKNFKNFKIIDKYADSQELLLITDILISDYSSIMQDFYLTGKPIILFTYDLEYYQKTRGLYFDIDGFAAGPVVNTGTELLNALKNVSDWFPKYIPKLKELNNRFNKFQDGNSCKRIFKILNIKEKKKA